MASDTTSPAADVAVLQLQPFSQQPSLDFGTVTVGACKTLHLTAVNPSQQKQQLVADKVPAQDGFKLSDGQDRPSTTAESWSTVVAPISSITLSITWQPTAVGPVSKLLVLKLDGKHRLQIKLLGKASVQFTKPKGATDQSIRSFVHGSDADAAAKRSKAAAAAQGQLQASSSAASAVQQQEQSQWAASTASAPKHNGAQKAPAIRRPRPSTAGTAPTKFAGLATSSLRLKAPAAAAAAAGGSNGPSATAARPSSATFGCPASRPSSAASKAGSLFPPNSPAAASRMSTYSTHSPVAKSKWPAPQSSCKQSVAGASQSDRARRSTHAGSIAAQQPPASARKTFKYFHTGNWLDKQDRAFTAWLNHLLLPYTAEYLRAASEEDTCTAMSDLRLLARVKSAMLACYRTDQEVGETMTKVEDCIDANRLRMKPGVIMFEDLVQRRQALSVLMSYNPFWLRLGLEVVTHKELRPHAHAAAHGVGADIPQQLGVKETLKGFIMQEFLSDKDLTAQMEASKGAAHYDMQQTLAEMSTLVLKRFLLLVLLLDRVATHLQGFLRVPLLFNVSGNIKSSKQVVVEFLHARLLGEGNVGRHLELLGYKLSYSQSPLMEYPFAVSSLSTDLRDGLRLIKVVEALTGDTSLLPQARFPSDKRSIQLYNTGLALCVLQSAGVQLPALPSGSGLSHLKPEDLVDGDRFRTLSLLWAIARGLQLKAVLQLHNLRAEVHRVVARVRQPGVTRALIAKQQHSSRENGPESAARGQLMQLAVYMNDELLSALMEWVQAVCRTYDIAVHNFTTCFADGIVLCLLVHYYLPNAINLADIYITHQRQREAAGPAASQLGSGHASAANHPAAVSCNGPESLHLQASLSGTAGPSVGCDSVTEASTHWTKGGWYGEIDVGGCDSYDSKDTEAEDATGVAANFRAIHLAAEALGAVPEMLSAADFAEQGPDERAVILYVALLCSRLLECSQDDRAAHVIQRAWQRRKARTAGIARAHLNAWVAAATVIQRAARAWLLGKCVRGRLAQQASAAVVLQSCWRARLVLVQQQQRRQAVSIIQHQWHQALSRQQAKQQQAVLVIQCGWRRYQNRLAAAWMKAFLRNCLQACQHLKQHRVARVAAACQIQCAWRTVLARRQFRRQRAAAVTVQAYWRRHQAMHRHQQLQAAAKSLQAAYMGLRVRQTIAQSHLFAVFLQSCARCRRDRARFLALRQVAITAQAAVCGWQARRRLMESQQACIVFQALARRHMVQHSLQQQQQMATTIQAFWRCSAARAAYRAQQNAAVSIQAAWRCWSAQQQHKQRLAAAAVLQTAWRGKQAKDDAALQQQNHAATVMAAAWRGRQTQQWSAGQVACIVQQQTQWRTRQQQKQYRAARAAAIMMHSCWRGKLARKQLQQGQRAATVIQSCWRGRQARLLLKQHKAATAAQKHWRRHKAQQLLRVAVQAATLVQAYWRGHVQGQAFSRARHAAVVTQAAVRSHQASSKHSSLQTAALTVQSCLRAGQAQQQLQQHKAAVVIQSHWLMHTAYCGYSTVVCAAVLVQSQYRAVVAARRCADLQGAAVAVQAAARGLAARQQLQQQQQAVTAVNAAWRGYVQRQQCAALHSAAVMLQACRRGAKSAQQHAALAAAAVAFQACWRPHKCRQLMAEQRAAAVMIQAAARRWRQLQQLQEHLSAAVTIQAAARRHQAQQAYLKVRAATVIIQAAARGMITRRSFAAQSAAATTIQVCWRMHAAHKRYHTAVQQVTLLQARWRMRMAVSKCQQQHAAASQMQAAWKGSVTRKTIAAQAAAATTMQALWHMRATSKQHHKVLQLLVKLQALWRTRLALGRYQQQKDAATALQAALRAREARSQLQRLHIEQAAAAVVQKYWKGKAARMQLQRTAAAAMVVQRCVRNLQAHQQLQAAVAYMHTARELQKMLLELHTRRRAATSIQCAWRGWRERKRLEPVWEAHRQDKAAATLQTAWRGAQARAFVARMHAQLPHARAKRAWLQLVQAAQVAQWQYQLQAAVRQEAVLTIQRAVRGWSVRHQVSKQLAGIRRFQALWRGFKVRKSCGRASRDARRRLAAVSAAAEAAPQRRIGVRTREALDVLLASRQCSQVISAVAAIEFSTCYSKACCQLMVDNGGITALLAFMRSCNRSKPHMDMLCHALACLANICRWPELLPGVLHAPDCINVLSEKLQMFRDTEEVFMPTVGILSSLSKSDEGAMAVAQLAPTVIKQWGCICQLLNRKMDMERRYIERLEGQKGSDVTAREATRKMVAAATQLDALQQVLERVESVAAAHGVQVAHTGRLGQSPAKGGAAPAAATVPDRDRDELVPRSAHAVMHPNAWQPKNTIVRGVLRESVNTYAAAAAAAACSAAASVQDAAGLDGAAHGGTGDVARKPMDEENLLQAHVQQLTSDFMSHADQLPPSHKHKPGHRPKPGRPVIH